jgi:hypothetical protein
VFAIKKLKTMNKKVFFTLACAAILALGFVCQNQSSVNALVDNNIEALTSSEGGANVSIESTTTYTWVNNPDNPAFYAPMAYHPVAGTVWTSSDHSLWDHIVAFFNGGVYSGDKYWCSETLTQVPTTYVCYEIVVRP